MSFASKRKARKIVHADDEQEEDASGPAVIKSKPFKKSSLRQSIAIDELHPDGEEAEAPNLPTIGRSNSTLKKKKKKASRLSFGPGEIISGDTAEALEEDEDFTPKKSVGRRVIEPSSLRNVYGADDDSERPTYSKDYLNELKSSTPTTRPPVSGDDDEEAGLDPSELDGAMIVETEPADISYIPSAAEIKEKKERRARLAAQEQDFIPLEDEESGGIQLSLLPRKKQETRLVREDEDVAEGFDEFVEDGLIALGKKQERAAKRAHRKEMEEQIRHAEGSSDEDSDDSDAERRAAYEAAQTRAGMDGLNKHAEEVDVGTQIPSKITPLPIMSECVARLQSTLDAMEQDMLRRQKRLADLEQEKKEILAREIEVQELLKQAGERYSSFTADSDGVATDPQAIIEAQSRSPLVLDRGLESFGNTPIVRPEVRDVS